MTDADIGVVYKQLGKIETSVAVLATSSAVRDKQIEAITKTLADHITKEEGILRDISKELRSTKETCDAKHAVVDSQFAEYRGALKGSRWLLGFLTGMAGIAIFLGLKGMLK